MTTYKRYITIQPLHKLNIEVKVGKKYIRVVFSNGGTLSGGNAIYTTSDEALQKALESSSMYGKVFKLQSAHNENPAPVEGPADDPEDTDNNPIENEEPKGQSAPVINDGAKSVEPIKFSTYNELRDWLVSEHGCVPADVRSTEAALAKAAELKLNVTLEK